MELLIDRKWKKDTYTIGKLYINGEFFSNTLEDKDRGLISSMSLEDINKKKVYGQTAIPTGTYEVRMTYSNRLHGRAYAKKYGGKLPELMNVKGYEGVRIHPFNKAQETLGCLSVGKNNIKGAITNATAYFYRLVDNYILPAIKRGEKITITIK